MAGLNIIYQLCDHCPSPLNMLASWKIAVGKKTEETTFRMITMYDMSPKKGPFQKERMDFQALFFSGASCYFQGV